MSLFSSSQFEVILLTHFQLTLQLEVILLTHFQLTLQLQSWK